MRIVAGLATIPNREKALGETVESLLPQVDHLFIYLNGYTEVPWWMVATDKIIPLTGENLCDAGKFKGLEVYKSWAHTQGKPFVYLSCDDDLIYPETYALDMLIRLQSSPMAIFSHHGRRFLKNQITNYFTDGLRYHCLNDVEQTTQVHIPGTGVTGFRGDLTDFTTADLPLNYPCMADIHLGKWAHENNRAVMVLKHDKGYIKHSQFVEVEDTLWHKYHKLHHLQTGLVNQVKWV